MKSKKSSKLPVDFIAMSCSQDFPELKNFPINEEGNDAVDEKKVLECANFILSVPLDRNSLFREYAEHILFLWMISNTDIKFEIGEKVGKIIKSNISLFSLYIACIAKNVLENKSRETDENGMNNNAVSMLLNYCMNKENNVVFNNTLRRIIRKRNAKADTLCKKKSFFINTVYQLYNKMSSLGYLTSNQYLIKKG